MADSLLEVILKGIKDERLLNTHRPGPSPLNDLIAVYSERTAHDDNLPNLDDASTGRHLKDAIGMMDADDQVYLLNQYALGTKGLSLPNPVKAEAPNVAATPEDPEEKRLKYWAIRVFVITMCVLACMLFGAVITTAVRSGRAPSNELLSTFLETATEIAKLIFSGGGGE